jgi:hypothetical protein
MIFNVISVNITSTNFFFAEKQTLSLPEKCNKNVKTVFCQTMCIELKYRVTNDFSEWLVRAVNIVFTSRKNNRQRNGTDYAFYVNWFSSNKYQTLAYSLYFVSITSKNVWNQSNYYCEIKMSLNKNYVCFGFLFFWITNVYFTCFNRAINRPLLKALPKKYCLHDLRLEGKRKLALIGKDWLRGKRHWSLKTWKRSRLCTENAIFCC